MFNFFQSRWRLKGCPRCQGDLYSFINNGKYRIIWHCLQCGYENTERARVVKGSGKRLRAGFGKG